MNYSISEFAELTGVSERTLRYYHQRGLLKPLVAANGYRQFTSADADNMQLIRFYTAAGFTLTQVTALLEEDATARVAALKQQRIALHERQERLGHLIAQIDSTIANQEGKNMSDTAKFAAFKQERVQQNDEQYGQEVTAKWGTDAKQEADEHFKGIDEATYQRSQQVERELMEVLRDAVASDSDAAGSAGEQAYTLHRAWLEIMWPNYQPMMHVNLMHMYVADDRFQAYYDERAGDGASKFLIQAVRHFAK
jgi:DNA-binding transcriptional MerR regulator